MITFAIALGETQTADDFKAKTFKQIFVKILKIKFGDLINSLIFAHRNTDLVCCLGKIR